jgi:hypothetical protein
VRQWRSPPERTLPEPLSTLAPRQPTIVISRVAKSRAPARSIHKRRDDSLGIRTRREIVRVDPSGPLIVRIGATTDRTLRLMQHWPARASWSIDE